MDAEKRKLDNILFYNEISPKEIPRLYEQCSYGIVSLDKRHKTHNIPGKFLSYMRSGLPVLAVINKNNDLEKIIKDNGVGFKIFDDKIKNILNPYFTTKKKGTGLGLAIVNKIINDHNGSIKFKDLNDGAKITINFLKNGKRIK